MWRACWTKAEENRNKETQRDSKRQRAGKRQVKDLKKSRLPIFGKCSGNEWQMFLFRRLSSFTFFGNSCCAAPGQRFILCSGSILFFFWFFASFWSPANLIVMAFLCLMNLFSLWIHSSPQWIIFALCDRLSTSQPDDVFITQTSLLRSLLDPDVLSLAKGNRQHGSN